jgi:hypothetical protein
MMQADPQGFVPQLHAYQDAINRADADAAAALFLETARIEEEGIQYPSVRAVLDYLVGERAHLELSDFHIQGQQVTCTYHEANELDRVVGYAGSRRKADFTFSQNQIAALVIHPLDAQERQYAHRLITPFFTWIKATHPAEWARMSALTYESGATLASMAQIWAASQPSP